MITSAVSLVLKGVLKRFLKDFQITSCTQDPDQGWQAHYKFTVFNIQVKENLMTTLKVPFLQIRQGYIDEIEIQLPALIPSSDEFLTQPTIVKVKKANLVVEFTDLPGAPVPQMLDISL